MLNDFAAALRDLNEAGLRYVIVGGLAVIRHGAGRSTDRLDLERLAAAHGSLPADPS